MSRENIEDESVDNNFREMGKQNTEVWNIIIP